MCIHLLLFLAFFFMNKPLVQAEQKCERELNKPRYWLPHKISRETKGSSFPIAIFTATTLERLIRVAKDLMLGLVAQSEPERFEMDGSDQ